MWLFRRFFCGYIWMFFWSIYSKNHCNGFYVGTPGGKNLITEVTIWSEQTLLSLWNCRKCENVKSKKCGSVYIALKNVDSKWVQTWFESALLIYDRKTNYIPEVFDCWYWRPPAWWRTCSCCPRPAQRWRAFDSTQTLCKKHVYFKYWSVITEALAGNQPINSPSDKRLM